MKNMSKKVGTVICILTLAMSMGTSVVSANNHKDTEFAFDFNGIGNKEQYTESRDKQDDSSMYINVIYAGGSFSVEAFGWSGSKRQYNKNAPYYVVKQGDARYITNYVYEDGYRQGGLHGWRDYWDGFTARGLWSPDSI